MKNNPAIKTFISAIVLLLVLLIATGALTYFIPSGSYDATTGVYTSYGIQGLSPLKWIAAPITVLFSDSGPLVIAIIVFLLIIGGSIHLLKETGLIEVVIYKIVHRFSGKAFALLGLLVFFFMSLGAFIGVFEEVVPLVPLVILLSRKMGWDDLTGLGISVLACGLGFAAAVTNPFTIGVAQGLAGVAIFSGAGLRLLIFISVYVLLVAFLWWWIQKTKGPAQETQLESVKQVPPKAYVFFLSLMSLMLLVIGISPFVEIIRDLSLPLIAVIFLVASIGVGLISFGKLGLVVKTFTSGIVDMLPAILLILLATGIKEVMIAGQILGTILYEASQVIANVSPLVALGLVFLLVMAMNFFIGSGSAKAFILMPILMPLMDMMGVGRQLGILAFQFGDGFSNVLYPTNAVLLIALGLSKVSYGQWLKFIFPLQVVLMAVSMGWIAIGYYLGYGL